VLGITVASKDGFGSASTTELYRKSSAIYIEKALRRDDRANEIRTVVCRLMGGRKRSGRHHEE
jgi:hypothetical protein